MPSGDSRDINSVAERLGLHRTHRRWGPCPACAADRTSDRRPPLRFGGDRWWCNACNRHGDAVDLACWALLHREVLKGDSDLRQVFDWLDGVAREPARPREPDRQPPPPAELARFLRSCLRAHVDLEVADYLRSRGIEPELAPAGAIPSSAGTRWWPSAWSSTWRLVVPAFGPRGYLRTLHARAVGPAQPKTRWPLDCDASGVVFADALGRKLLRGEGVDRLIVTEGLPDYLHTSAESRGSAAVWSVESGSESVFRLVRLPAACKVYVATHADVAGERYAQSVADALAPHPCRRVPLELLRRRAA